MPIEILSQFRVFPSSIVKSLKLRIKKKSHFRINTVAYIRPRKFKLSLESLFKNDNKKETLVVINRDEHISSWLYTWMKNK